MNHAVADVYTLIVGKAKPLSNRWMNETTDRLIETDLGSRAWSSHHAKRAVKRELNAVLVDSLRLWTINCRTSRQPGVPTLLPDNDYAVRRKSLGLEKVTPEIGWQIGPDVTRAS